MYYLNKSHDSLEKSPNVCETKLVAIINTLYTNQWSCASVLIFFFLEVCASEYFFFHFIPIILSWRINWVRNPSFHCCIPKKKKNQYMYFAGGLKFKLHACLGSCTRRGCINSTTFLSVTPKVTIVQRGTSASIFLSNAAYPSFIYSKFHVSPLWT